MAQRIQVVSFDTFDLHRLDVIRAKATVSTCRADPSSSTGGFSRSWACQLEAAEDRASSSRRPLANDETRRTDPPDARRHRRTGGAKNGADLVGRHNLYAESYLRTETSSVPAPIDSRRRGRLGPSTPDVLCLIAGQPVVTVTLPPRFALAKRAFPCCSFMPDCLSQCMSLSSGYQMGLRPQTLYGIADSPVGLAAYFP